MKILLLTGQRTRSTILIDALSQKYNLKNLYEEMIDKFEPPNFVKKTLIPKHDKVWGLCTKELKKYNEKLHEQDNFAIKIIPSCFINSLRSFPPCCIEPDYNLTKFDFLDLETYFSLSKYDKIFLLYREDYVSAVLSYIHARRTDFFNYTQQEHLNNNPSNKKYKLFFESQNPNYEYWYIRTLLLNVSMTPYIESYLKEYNLNYIKLEYRDIPNYIKEYCPSYNPKSIDNNYRYKTNSEDCMKLESKIINIKEEIDKNLQSIFAGYSWIPRDK